MDIETCLVRYDCDVSTDGSFLALEYVLLCVERGTLFYRSEQKNYEISAGDMILIPPNILHAVSETKNLKMTVIHFNDHSQFLEVNSIIQVVKLPDKYFSYLLKMTDLLRENWTAGKKNELCICNGITQTLVGIHLKTSVISGKKSVANEEFKNWESIRSAIQFIQKNFPNPELSIMDVSKHVALSYNYFSSHFSSYTNETPLNYLNRIRIENAKTLMYLHRLNISQAAYESGFKSPQYFSKIFRQKEGQSPSRWLKSFT